MSWGFYLEFERQVCVLWPFRGLGKKIIYTGIVIGRRLFLQASA